MPSYYTSLYEIKESFEHLLQILKRTKVKLLFSNPQLDWRPLYLANQKAIIRWKWNITGYEPASGMFYEDQVQVETGAVTTNISSSLSENISVNAGFI
jgi:hypothetical protein